MAISQNSVIKFVIFNTLSSKDPQGYKQMTEIKNTNLLEWLNVILSGCVPGKYALDSDCIKLLDHHRDVKKVLLDNF